MPFTFFIRRIRLDLEDMYINRKVEEDTGHSDMSNFVKLFIILSIKLYVKIYYMTK